MLSVVLYNVNYEMIEKINYNNMWKYIYILSLTNKELYETVKRCIIKEYISTMRMNIKIMGQNNYIIPAKVLARCYKDTITVTEDKYAICKRRIN